MIPKRNKRVAALLASRTSGTGDNTGARELPSLNDPTDSASMLRAVLGRTGFGGVKNPQSLVTDDGVIPLPDEDELERVRRRKAARRGGGRASTVLSDENRLGG